MLKLISALVVLSLSTAVFPVTAQTEGEIVPPDQVPSDVPEWHRQKWYQYPVLPQGWNAAIPTGGALTSSGSGKVEISAFKLICNIPGKGRQTVVSDVQSIGAGLYLRNPWFGNNDYNEAAKMSYTSDGTVIMDVPPNRVLHWWTNYRAEVPAGTNNCSAEAVVRGTGNVIAGVGGNWWKTSTAQWAGFNVNNKEIVNGDWYYLSGGEWEVIRADP